VPNADEAATGKVRFVQESLLQHYSSALSSDDKVFFFTTDEATKKNRENDGHAVKDSDGKWQTLQRQGLKERLESINLKCSFEKVRIEDGKSENELWSIFQTVYGKIEPNDELIFDVTHSFRVLPMFNVVLLHFASVIKATQVKAIHYGAYEAKANEIAPVWDLKPLISLQSWITAANSFVRYGITDDLFILAKSETTPMLNASKGKDEVAGIQKKLASSLHAMNLSLTTNRGNAIESGEPFEKILNALNLLKDQPEIIPPLRMLLTSIDNKLSEYQNFKNMYWLYGVKWCVDYNLVQQGITQMQEGIITHLCKQLALQYDSKAKREELSSIISYHFSKEQYKSDWKWKEQIISNEKRKEILQFLLGRVEADVYNQISDKRNNINHGGYCDADNPESFGSKLRECYQKLVDELIPKLSKDSMDHVHAF
jgi:CRISPR-associated Csx2 family protein